MSVEFYVITKEVEFEETLEKGARILATIMELEKPSRNNRLYKITEGEQIANSLKGKPVYYGTDAFGRHDNPFKNKKSKNEPVGFVEVARVVGNKIKGVIRIFNNKMITALRKGVKYLFSVGGNAISETIKKIKGKLIHILTGARCNHLQIIDMGTPVGFPDAKMEKLIEIQETVMICSGGVCNIQQCTPKKKKKRIVIEEEDYEFSFEGRNYRVIL